MSEDTEYVQLLAEAIEKRRAHVAEKVIPELKEAFRTFHSSYQGLWNIFQRKGLVQEDPYKNDQKISDAVAPSDEPFMESEKDQQMSVRLSAFDNTLDYLTNYFEFSLDHIDLRRVKNLVGIANYIKWNNLSEASPKFTTRALAEYASKLRGEADPLSVNLLKDAVEQLSKTQRTLLSYLKQIAEVKKAEYKLYLREEVVPEAKFDPNSAYQNREQTLRAMKKVYSAKNSGNPFFTELAGELIEEDYGPEGETLRQQVVDALAVEESKAKQKPKQDALRPLLMDGIRALAGVSRIIEQCMEKIDENISAMENRNKGFGDRLREWIDRLVNREQPSRVFDVEYLDEASSTTHTERIQFDSFKESMLKRARLYGAILNKLSNVSRKLEDAGEDQLFVFLQKHLEELFVAHRQLQSLDTHIRAETPRAQRNSLRGINAELTALKETLTKANKKKHAYVAKKEEQEQFRKLGIDE
ncbi:MAG: hypothetical protein GVY29_01945 [Spirochaetes bacterium]|jgi:hypothetical protein|nr:hypothetical protein [Spirochaetota bacterium]